MSLRVAWDDGAVPDAEDEGVSSIGSLSSFPYQYRIGIRDATAVSEIPDSDSICTCHLGINVVNTIAIGPQRQGVPVASTAKITTRSRLRKVKVYVVRMYESMLDTMCECILSTLFFLKIDSSSKPIQSK